MIQRLHRSIKLLLLASFTFLLLSACQGNALQNTAAQGGQSPASECRVIQHMMGETCVPVNPQRIIAVNENVLEVVLALGMKPIAAGEPDLLGSRARHLARRLEGIASIGKESQLNLERMVLLNPDLILGFTITPENYKLFSQIAPTVNLEYDQVGWKEALLRFGEILGKSQQAEQLLAQYKERVEKFRAAMGKRLKKTEVSVSRFYAGYQTSEFRTRFSFPGSILEDVGLPRPAAQRRATRHNEPYVQISLERIDLLDGDVIFAALDRGSESSFERFQTSPLWQTLRAVKNNQVYTVDSGYWIFGNILAANAILDDLFKYLAQEKR